MHLLAVAVLATFASYTAYYYLRVIRRPVLHFKNSSFHRSIIEQCPVLSEPYKPTFWCFNNHLMLLLFLFREFRAKPYHYDRIEQLKMKDGGTTGLAWSGMEESKKSRTPIVVVFHTISGDEQDVTSMVRCIRNLNWTAVVCIRRGHGSLPLSKPRFNTMGSTSDLTEQLARIQKQFPEAPLFGVGISAGSGLLARYLGESGSRGKFQAAVAISPAYDLEVAFMRVHPVYSKLMRTRLIRYFLERHPSLSEIRGFEHAKLANNLAEFQDRIYALAGYESREEYYKHSNPIKVVKGIRTPLLILNSADDPICVNENVMENLHWLEHLDSTMLVHTERGSHVAYLEGMRGTSWAERVVGQYLQAIMRSPKRTRSSPTRKPPGAKRVARALGGTRHSARKKTVRRTR
ncbi:MAG: alpha/beta hydrolase [Leptospirales bacterium]|nr:alpha/beta hydrolase [Leptospirales bacterium]